jgi:AGZA family xanthine/uracil permease-like MFS transporter
MLDNIADLLLTVSLLALVFDFPTKFALSYMVPGTAIGVLVGDLLFFWLALRVARQTGRKDLTAMPLGLDTPSTFGMVFFVLGPAFLYAKFQLGMDETAAAHYTWKIGICSIVLSGVFKFACAFASGWIRKAVPRAGLLGSLAAVALVLISFLPLLEIFHFPIVGMIALAIILTTLVARIPLPGKMPGALGALLVAGTIYYLMLWTGTLGHTPDSLGIDPYEALLPTGWFEVFQFQWVSALQDSLTYLPIVIPFALGTVVGGIDCVESAAAAGDEYDTRQVIGIEALATLIAGLCGGVIQTTPYIGHPAYKAMGGRSAYVLATALFVGSAGVLGYFGFLYAWIPKPTVFPILVFIGLEITAQSFLATPKKHYPAVAIACVPALAALAMIFLGELQGQYAGQVLELGNQVAAVQELANETGSSAALQEAAAGLKQSHESLEHIAGSPKDAKIGEPFGPLGKNMQTLRMLSNGFIVTSLLWAAALASLIDRRLYVAAAYFGVAGVFALFGIIHSPMPGSPVVNPFSLPHNLPHAAGGQTPIYMAIAYCSVALMLVVWGAWLKKKEPVR